MDINREEFQKILKEAVNEAYLRGFSNALRLASESFTRIISDLTKAKTEFALKAAEPEPGREGG